MVFMKKMIFNKNVPKYRIIQEILKEDYGYNRVMRDINSSEKYKNEMKKEFHKQFDRKFIDKLLVCRYEEECDCNPKRTHGKRYMKRKLPKLEWYKDDYFIYNVLYNIENFIFEMVFPEEYPCYSNRYIDYIKTDFEEFPIVKYQSEDCLGERSLDKIVDELNFEYSKIESK